MKVGIVGSGAVGSSAGYAMVMSGAASEVVLVEAPKKDGLGQSGSDAGFALGKPNATGGDARVVLDPKTVGLGAES